MILLDGFVALTAGGGGIVMAVGVDRFPPEWIEGSPFADYFLPGVILTLVGITAAVAAVAAWRRSRWAAETSASTGAVLVGWIAGEIVLLQRNGADQDPRSPTEAIYLAVGILILGLGLLAAIRNRRARRVAETA
jgi:predicted tellurium resistance membrane protein TerC